MTAFSVADDRFHAYCLGNFRVHTTERMTASMQACGHANVSVHAAQRFLCNTLRAEEERDNQLMDMEGVALATEISTGGASVHSGACRSFSQYALYM